MHALPRRALAAASLALACAVAPPDLRALAPLRAEDARVINLLREADRDGERDPRGAARTLRELVLPRARANAAACGRTSVVHPRAQALASELCSLLDERALRVERYAAALDADDLAARLREVRAQRALEDDVARFENRFEAEERAPPPRRGCSR
ncbi:MAG: hypothetical protein U0324_14285 [Polyangiales bacterium]